MAPWPEQGSEPKAIDKDEKRDLGEVIPKQELEESTESSIAAKSDQVPKQPEEKEVGTLDEGQLKALLDEAITYKNPKDREGKSELFKELLRDVEADEGENKGLGSSLTGKLPKAYYNIPARRRHSRLQGRECGVGVSTTRGGSLQNLNALGMDSSRGRSRRSGRCGDTLVSARQREGGSLPTNVNVDNDTDLDSIYTSRATLEVTVPCNEEKVKNVEEANVSTVVQSTCLPNGSEVPFQFGMYCPVAKEEVQVKTEEPILASCITVAPIDFDSVVFGRSANTVQQHISRLSLSPSQINIAPEHREVDKKLNTSKQRVQHKKGPTPARCEETVRHGEELERASERFRGFPLSAHWNCFSSCIYLNYRELSLAAFVSKDQDSKAKSLDENGNALNNVRAEANCLDRKKQRRVLKTKNDRNSRDFLSDDIEGFRGGADIETLMEYIESPSNILEGSKAKVRPNQINGPRNHVKMRAKEEDSRPIKRRTKEKFKRCNSLEEISKTKLEDLTEESSSERVSGPSLTVKKKHVTLDDAQLRKKSSWDDESFLGDTSVVQRNRDCKPGKGSQEGLQDSEFHLVTKKQRKKKRRSAGSRPPVFSRGFPAHDRTLERSDASGLLYQYRDSKSCSQPRRKSASSVPPSDKSDSSDLDSVHSLPVSSSTSRTKVGKNSVSGDSTPQASYADIARTMATPPIQGNVYCRGNYLSSDLEMLSSDRIPNVMLPASFVSSFKKDAMTDTTCDNIKPTLPNEEYPPLEIKSTELFIEKTVKRTCSARDNIPEGKMSIKTVPFNNIVIPVNKTEVVPVDVPPLCVKSSSLSNPNCKRPPVILMDELMVDSEVPTELTFGFEVNQQLLQCEVPMCNINNETLSSNVASTSLLSSSPAPSRDDNLNRLIQYHNSAWDDITKDLCTGRAVYYNGQ